MDSDAAGCLWGFRAFSNFLGGLDFRMFRVLEERQAASASDSEFEPQGLGLKTLQGDQTRKNPWRALRIIGCRDGEPPESFTACQHKKFPPTVFFIISLQGSNLTQIQWLFHPRP